MAASSRAGTQTEIVQSRSAASSSGGNWEWWYEPVRRRYSTTMCRTGGVEALLRLLDQALLEPVELPAGVREQDDLVGRVGRERVLERQQRVLLAAVPPEASMPSSSRRSADSTCTASARSIAGSGSARKKCRLVFSAGATTSTSALSAASAPTR